MASSLSAVLALLSMLGPHTGAPAPARPLTFRQVDLPTGVRLRYAEQGPPEGRPIVLLHGYSDSWFSWSLVLPLLPDSLRVLALDLRGHGESSQPAGGYALRDLAADVIALLDAQGITRATVVGHSMGSLVAQQVALAAPERVDRLVLVGSGTTFRRATDIGELEAAVNQLTDPVATEFVRSFQESTVYAPLPADFLDRVVVESGKLTAPVWRALMVGMLGAAVPTRLGALGIPTLVLWGDHDSVFPRSEQDALLALVPTATLKVYPETGHALHWERPAEFARDLVSFLGAP